VGQSCFHWLSEAPDLSGLIARFPKTFPFLLDSTAQGPLGTHSLLLYAASDPAGDQHTLTRHVSGQVTGPGAGTGFFDRLESWFQAEQHGNMTRPDESERQAPFCGGWFVYLGYEMAGESEGRLKLPANTTGLPDAFARRCPGAIIVFHGREVSGPKSLVVGESPAVVADILDHLQHSCAPDDPVLLQLPELKSLQADDPQTFIKGVERILEYLRAGDVFQVNLSRGWSGCFGEPADPHALHQALRKRNPAPFAGWMRCGGMSMLSSSPERLVQIRDRRVQTRPIAGTRPRSANPAEDLALSRELINNVKERAEHVMLIDLERNDLGRVCRPGTVEVDELMAVESYAHVHHIVSNVRGVLAPGLSPVDAIRAVFPGGTITGCPKVRCMEIIAEIEQIGRGFYTGSMGYLGLNGDLDLNILIRSILLNGHNFSFRTGAGIVADSLPANELRETEDKARGLLVALEQNDGVVANA